MGRGRRKEKQKEKEWERGREKGDGGVGGRHQAGCAGAGGCLFWLLFRYASHGSLLHTENELFVVSGRQSQKRVEACEGSGSRSSDGRPWSKDGRMMV